MNTADVKKSGGSSHKRENRVLELTEQLCERTDGACRGGAGPYGIGVENCHQGDFRILLLFAPPLVEKEVLFPDHVTEYTVQLIAESRAIGFRLLPEHLEAYIKEKGSDYQILSQLNELLLAEPCHVTGMECVDAFCTLLERELEQSEEEPEPAMSAMKF